MKKPNSIITRMARSAVAFIVLICLYGAADFTAAYPLADNPPQYEAISPFHFGHPYRGSPS